MSLVTLQLSLPLQGSSTLLAWNKLHMTNGVGTYLCGFGGTLLMFACVETQITQYHFCLALSAPQGIVLLYIVDSTADVSSHYVPCHARVSFNASAICGQKSILDIVCAPLPSSSSPSTRVDVDGTASGGGGGGGRGATDRRRVPGRGDLLCGDPDGGGGWRELVVVPRLAPAWRDW